MPRPIWTGAISLGLVNIPVMLFSAQHSERSHMHLLDKKNKSRIHYERINDKSGKKVEWQDVVKAYEYEKDNYVIINEKELETTEPDFKTIDLKEFVEQQHIEFPYIDKPYYLTPSLHGEKGYALLLETLEKTKKVGIATVVFKTKQHMAALVPFKGILLLNVLRYQNELKNPQDFIDSKERFTKVKLSAEEIAMAERLIKSMTSQWNPKKYHNKSHELMVQVIENKIKRRKTVVAANEPSEEKSKMKKGKVVDFMSLLKKSLTEKNKKTPKRRSPLKK